MDIELQKLQEKVQKHVTEKRYIHTIGVRYTAAALAMRFNPTIIKKAEIGGILHDCAKCYSDKEMIQLCKKNSIECSETEINNPALLHAKLGVVYAQNKYNIQDEDILHAIRFHTTGKPEMTLLEKILFTADYIEPNRKMIEGLTEIRQMAFVNLDQAVYMILKNTLSYLNDTKKETIQTLDTQTVNAYEYYKTLVEQSGNEVK